MTSVASPRQHSRIAQAASASKNTLRGQLPPRYDHYERHWRSDFDDLAARGLREGADILDVGAGRSPTIAREVRPAGVNYVGLDIARSELDLAPPGSYHEKIGADIATPVVELRSRFDLVLSWQVLEHVRSLPQALSNLHDYLRPGGYLVALMSARFSAFGLLNRVLPRRVGFPIVARAMRRDQETVFPAYYDQCYDSALIGLTAQWSEVSIVAAWAGAGYFGFARPLQAAYVLYEEWAFAAEHRNLATHYYLCLRK